MNFCTASDTRHFLEKKKGGISKPISSMAAITDRHTVEHLHTQKPLAASTLMNTLIHEHSYANNDTVQAEQCC
jgi:hypothetical protein